MRDLVLAIDAGGTNFKSALLDGNDTVEGGILSVPVDSQGAKENIFNAYRTVISTAISYAQGHDARITAAGVSTPGPFDYAGGRSMMKHKFMSICGIDLREVMRAGGLPADVPIRFLHDAHAFILGEFACGAAQGYSNAAGITLGTGIGSGWILDGTLRANDSGGPLVSLFKLPCRGVTLEDLASGRGIAAAYEKHRGPSSGVDAKEISRRAIEENDRQAVQVFEEMGTVIGESIAPLVQEHRIECVVFGGQIARSFDLFAPAVRAALRTASEGCAVIQAKHIDTAALIGAAHA